MDFVAIDVETANSDVGSICQIGIVTFREGAMVSTWQRLVDPEAPFDPWNVAIHGITEEDVRGAPTLPQLYPELRLLLDDAVVACHTLFDRAAFARAAEKYRLRRLSCSWLDTAQVVRRTWTQYAQRGYGLANICQELEISFRHHDAEEDARAAGEVLLRAIAVSGLGVDEWVQRTTPAPARPKAIQPGGRPAT